MTCDPPRTRTWNQLIKSQLLCQIELVGHPSIRSEFYQNRRATQACCWRELMSRQDAVSSAALLLHKEGWQGWGWGASRPNPTPASLPSPQPLFQHPQQEGVENHPESQWLVPNPCCERGIVAVGNAHSQPPKTPFARRPVQSVGAFFNTLLLAGLTSRIIPA